VNPVAAKKLNSMRVLEREDVRYEVLTFPESVHSAEGVAEFVGLPATQVYKTLVVERPSGGKPLLVMVPGDRELDLKQLAACLGEKKLQMASHKDAERLTGLQVGGISALALLNRGFEICLDRRALELDEVVISAGQRGINLKLAVRDLTRVTHPRLVDAS
jgi:Cys-tRNA(Pro)/Cys-tRNA(Cys) deacylase